MTPGRMTAPLGAVAIVVMLSGCGGGKTVTSDGTSKATATNVVARVQNVPITLSEYDHWSAVAQCSSSKSGSPCTATGPSSRTHDEVLAFLISSAWVEAEAAERHLQLSPQDIETQYQRIKRQQFPHVAEFQRFLSSSHQTEDDLRHRVRLNLLSTRIQHQLRRSGGVAAIKELTSTFKARWQPRTYCLPEFMVADCGHQIG